MHKNSKSNLLAKIIMCVAFAVIILAPYLFLFKDGIVYFIQTFDCSITLIVSLVGIDVSCIIALYGTIRYG